MSHGAWQSPGNSNKNTWLYHRTQSGAARVHSPLQAVYYVHTGLLCSHPVIQDRRTAPSVSAAYDRRHPPPPACRLRQSPASCTLLQQADERCRPRRLDVSMMIRTGNWTNSPDQELYAAVLCIVTIKGGWKNLCSMSQQSFWRVPGERRRCPQETTSFKVLVLLHSMGHLKGNVIMNYAHAPHIIKCLVYGCVSVQFQWFDNLGLQT